MTPQETDPDLPVSVQESWVSSGLPSGLGALNVAVHAWDILKKVAIIFITSTIAWTQVKTGKENISTHQQKSGLKIY